MYFDGKLSDHPHWHSRHFLFHRGRCSSDVDLKALRSPSHFKMQLPSAVATRSVGDKLSPHPWRSFGASVVTSFPDRPCTACNVNRLDIRLWFRPRLFLNRGLLCN